MRLFTFGCSFTQYKWPTWADILGKNYDFFENWGKCGAGNMYIGNTVVQANIQHSFTKDDTVIIMWSNMMREDRYLYNTGWVGAGNIYSQGIYDEDFVRKYVTVRGCYLRDMVQIYLIEQLLEKIGCKYHFLSMVDVNNPMQYTNEPADEIYDILTFYKSTVDKFKPSVHKTVFNYKWKSRIGMPNDSHPMPILHLEYLDKVLPEFHISNETREWVTMINEFTRNGTPTDRDEYAHFPKPRI